MIAQDLYEKIECYSAREFINLLRSSSELWLDAHEIKTRWLFRGQGDLNHELVATAWRKSNFEMAREKYYQSIDFFNSIIHDVCKDTKSHFGYSSDYSETEVNEILQNDRIVDIYAVAAYEMELAKQFALFLDDLGFSIPKPGQAYLGSLNQLLDASKILSEFTIHCLQNSTTDFHRRVFGAKSHPLIALARHHGIPSSLVDFTENPIIAAFFAADSATVNTEIAVWAIHSQIIGSKNRLQSLDVFKSDLGYLHAQDGVLVYDSQSDLHYMQQGQWPCISEVFSSDDFQLNPKSIFKCVTLPSSEAKEVLRLLRAEKIARPYLMPSFNTIADTITQQFEFPH